METNESQEDFDRKQEGSPIMVGGGGGLVLEDPGVSCDFNEAFYTDQTGGGPRQKRFANANEHAMSLKLSVNGATADLTGLLPNDGDCKIKIGVPGDDNDVIIAGRPLGIELHTGTYRDPPAGSHQREGRVAARELVIGVSNFEIKRNLQPQDVWKIVVKNVR